MYSPQESQKSFGVLCVCGETRAALPGSGQPCFTFLVAGAAGAAQKSFLGFGVDSPWVCESGQGGFVLLGSERDAEITHKKCYFMESQSILSWKGSTRIDANSWPCTDPKIPLRALSKHPKSH